MYILLAVLIFVIICGACLFVNYVHTNNVEKKRLQILIAITRYEFNRIINDTDDPSITYEDMEPAEKTYGRRGKDIESGILPEDKYNLIKPFIRK